jgi:dTMP kinase
MTSEALAPPYSSELVLPGLVTIEGLDGSGKTTQMDLLTDHLKQMAVPFVRLREPSELPTGQQIRKLIQSQQDLYPQRLLELFINDRLEDLRQNIRPALAAGKIALLDRYLYSNAAYQGVDLGWARVIEQNLTQGVALPHKSFLLEIAPQEGLGRVEERGEGKTTFEKSAFLQQVANNYRQIKQWDPNMEAVDASQSPERVHEIIKAKLALFWKRQGAAEGA